MSSSSASAEQMVMEYNVVYLWPHDIAIIHIATNIKAPIMAENKIIGNNAPVSSFAASR